MANNSETPTHKPHPVCVEDLSTEDEDSVLVSMNQHGKYSIYMTDGKTMAESAYGMTGVSMRETGSLHAEEIHSTVQGTETETVMEVTDVVREIVPGRPSRESSVNSDHNDSDSIKPRPAPAQNLHVVKPPGREVALADGEAQFIAIPHKDLIRIPADQLVITAEKSTSSWFSMSSAGGTVSSPPASSSTVSPGGTVSSSLTPPKQSGSAQIDLNAKATKETDPVKKDTGSFQVETSRVTTDTVVDGQSNTTTVAQPPGSDTTHSDTVSSSSTVAVNHMETSTSTTSLTASKTVNLQTSTVTEAKSQQEVMQISDQSEQSVVPKSLNDSESFIDSLEEVAKFPTHSTSTPVKSLTSEVSHSSEAITHVQSQTSTVSLQASRDSEATNQRVQHIEKNTHTSRSLDISHIVQEHTINETYSQRPDVSDNSDFKIYMHMSEELGKVTREKARLEGHVEMLEAEAKQTLNDRADLQARVAALSEKLKTFESSQVGIVGDRNALAADLETLRQDRARLEQVAVDASKLLQDKDTDIKTCKDDIRLGHEAQDKLQEKIKELKREMSGSEVTVQDLKSKIAELYVEFQTCNQNKILAESEIKSLQSEIKSLSTGKEWYQDQLHAVQESKAQLRNEITRIKSEMIAQSTAIEKLKVDNIRVKQQLSETEQRGLREKEMLARHLEAIELDMVDREAAFVQIQRERQTMETALQHKSDDLPPDLADELKKAKNDLRRRQAQVGSLEHERDELVKRITLAQESIAERDRNVDDSEKKLLDLEITLKQAQLEITTKDEQVLQMNQEKSALEVELSRAKEEKKTFDSALQTLKSDMGKVEHSFKGLKTELSDKQSELARLRSANQSLKEKVENVEDISINAAVKESVQQAAVHSADVPYKVDEALLQELEHLRQSQSGLKKQVALLQSETSDSTKALISQNEVLDKEIATLKGQLEGSEVDKQALTAERDNVQRDLMSTKERILELDLNFQKVLQEQETLVTKLESTTTAAAVAETSDQVDQVSAYSPYQVNKTSVDKLDYPLLVSKN